MSKREKVKEKRDTPHPALEIKMALIFTIMSLFFMPASLAEGAFEILLPKNTSLWVANGKARRVAIASHQGEIDTWNMEVTDNKGHAAHAYPPDIIFPQEIGGKSVYVKHLLVPETLKSGEYKLKICGSLKDGRKLCQKSDAFYIEGDQVESLHNKDDLQPHEKRFRSRLSAFEDYLRKLDVEEIWPIHETHCTIPKIHKPSKEEFTEKCMKPGQACIITGMMGNWKAMSKWLFETFQHDPRIEDGVYVGQRLTPVPLTKYVKYLKERAANETAPWVIFMSDVFDLYPELRKDYIIPDFFAESDDFMNNVDEELRLDWRWIIMAAKRSGSGWHVDPANTTGWLALVQGAKLWGMYPPSVYHIPGVKNNYYQKRDYDMEDAFYWWIYTRPYLKSNLPIECVQKPGDIVFIPTGWWHSVVNLDDTVSVTQNFCNKYSLRNCLTELREQADSDGGFIGRTFEQLRELYAEKYPQYFQQEDLDFEAPVKGHGLTEEEEKSRRLRVLKDFLSGSTKTIV